jgi:hypothetical protein
MPPRGGKGELPQGFPDHRHVISRGVRPGVARAQQHRQRLPGPFAAVIGKRPQRMKPKATFIGSRGGLLGRIRRDQGGIEVDHQRSSGVDPGVRGILAG